MLVSLGSNVRFGSRPRENSNARRARRNILDKLRFIRTYNTPDIRLDAMLENYIFYISRMYEFSHSLGHLRPTHSAPVPANVRSAHNSDRFWRPSEMTPCAMSDQRTAANGTVIQSPRRRARSRWAVR